MSKVTAHLKSLCTIGLRPLLSRVLVLRPSLDTEPALLSTWMLLTRVPGREGHARDHLRKKKAIPCTNSVDKHNVKKRVK